MQKLKRGVAQFGRAPRSGRGGRKFKSCHLDQKKAGYQGIPCFFYQDLNLRASFRKSGKTDFREEHSADVPIKSGKTKSPRPKKAGYQGIPCFFYQDLNLRASFRKSGKTDFREEHSANVPIKSGKLKSPLPKKP